MLLLLLCYHITQIKITTPALIPTKTKPTVLHINETLSTDSFGELQSPAIMLTRLLRATIHQIQLQSLTLTPPIHINIQIQRPLPLARNPFTQPHRLPKLTIITHTFSYFSRDKIETKPPKNTPKNAKNHPCALCAARHIPNSPDTL